MVGMFERYSEALRTGLDSGWQPPANFAFISDAEFGELVDDPMFRVRDYYDAFAAGAGSTQPVATSSNMLGVDLNLFWKLIRDRTKFALLSRLAVRAWRTLQDALTKAGRNTKIHFDRLFPGYESMAFDTPEAIGERVRRVLNAYSSELNELSPSDSVLAINRDDIRDDSVFAVDPSVLYERAAFLDAFYNMSDETTKTAFQGARRHIISMLRWRAIRLIMLKRLGVAEGQSKYGGDAIVRGGAVVALDPLLAAAGIRYPRLTQDQENALCALARYIAMGIHSAGIPSIIQQVLSARSGPLGDHVMSPAEEGATLTYMEDNEEPSNVVKVVALTGPGEEIARNLTLVGMARFNTTIIRKLVFITQLQRIVRKQLSRVLTHERDVLRSSHAGVAPEVTEYGFDPYSANEVSTSRPRGLNYGVAPNAGGTWDSGEGRWLDKKE